ncbi:MarR family winged helix-turn-helix transcriptional regulator [Acidovorax sp.]|uniref:MarR family winged helix-turn-helix transcriptional regulator n=1 Tax=Acidovorax sp. TaxID=1872122 RepID=UPI001AC62864|nr:MarR family transcriptional regulator [Acidovorax sp.]MBN9628229.1 MarR family transcriptional regulator [Acidovorax sp.]
MSQINGLSNQVLSGFTRKCKEAPVDGSKEFFLFRLNRLAAMAGQPLVRLCEGKFGITRREWRLIVVLSQSGPLLSSDLATRAMVEPARTSKAVSQLVEKGLALRVPRPNDRRCVEIHLSERAKEIYAELYPVLKDINNALLSTLPDADRQHLERIFVALEHKAADLLATGGFPKIDRSKQRGERPVPHRSF